MAMIGSNLELQIDQLVLHGFSARDRVAIGAALQQELTRLFTERGIPAALARGGEFGRLEGGAFEMAAGARPEAMGAQIARSIYSGFGGGGGSDGATR